MTRTVSLTSGNVQHTLDLGRRIGAVLQAGDVLGLVGPLGAGKTWLVKGLAAGLDVADLRTVNSPTYVIVNEYRGRLHVYHIDAYRLNQPGELEALGFEEMCNAGGVVVVEWADRVETLLPVSHVRIELRPSGPQHRDIDLCAAHPAAEALLERIEETLA